MLPNLAMTGEADLTKLKAGNTVLREGLGLVPFLVDQHFLKRQRQNRLMSALIDHPEFKGVGVDEDNAVRFEDGNLEAYGESPAMIYSYDRSIAQFCVGILQGGQMEPLN
jgi:cyanophycinase